MLTAHLPSGWLLSCLAIDRLKIPPQEARAFFIAGILGAIAPDFDMLWFYLVNAGQVHHHRYFTHWPILWLTLFAASCLLCHGQRHRRAGQLAALFCAGCLLHLVLDSLVGDIWWLAPVVDKPFALATVPRHFEPWWLNFILHWSFAAELAIWAAAIWLFLRQRVQKQPTRLSEHPMQAK
ncbi:MAG: metal-dependent hydrolase [Zoogloeaceae bacterium]|nr:metal-dependent hydrolase [Zoogloeaceae bacterium]